MRTDTQRLDWLIETPRAQVKWHPDKSAYWVIWWVPPHSRISATPQYPTGREAIDAAIDRIGEERYR